MAENKKSFIFYSDWIDTFRELPKDKAYELFMHLLAYVNDENPESNDAILKALFSNMKNTLKRDLKKWEKQQNQRVEAGKRSAEIRKQNATTVNERSISSTVSVNGSVNVNDVDNSNKPPTHNFFTIYDFEKIEIGENEFTLLATRQGNKTIQEVKKLLPAFLKIQKGLNKITWQDEADAKKHFINWLKKQPKSFYNNSPSN